MKKENGEHLLRVAEAVTDGNALDWEKETSGDVREVRLLQNLQAIDRISSFHRSVLGALPDVATRRLGTGETQEMNRWGALKIVRSLGRGGYGEVFLAHDPGLQTDVALKLLHPGVEQVLFPGDDYRAEARRLARVRHPNVVRVLGVDREAGRIGIVYDLIEGTTLEALLHRNGPFGPAESAHIGVELCRALASVHGADLIHGDIKTSNVMRETGGRIVLMDFGCAVERPFPDTGGSRIAAGTGAFMAPELFEGQGVDTCTDIYSLGVLLYRLVTGSYPVEGESLAALRDEHRRGETRALLDVRPDLPVPFVRAVEKALARDPARRYRSAGEMEAALSGTASAVPGETSPVSAATRSEEPSPSRWWVPLAAGAALVAAFFLLRPLFLSPAFEADAAVFRLGPGVEERLAEGAELHPGDQLFLELRGSRDMYVYIFNEDEQGSAYLLFPLPGLDTTNPVAGDAPHRFPGTMDGEPFYWDVTSAGGVETILVVASKDRLPDLEETLASLPQPGVDRPVEVPGQTLVTLRGIGGMSKAPSASGNGLSGVSRIIDDLSIRAGNRGDVWEWELKIPNPGN